MREVCVNESWKKKKLFCFALVNFIKYEGIKYFCTKVYIFTNVYLTHIILRRHILLLLYTRIHFERINNVFFLQD